MKKFFWMTAGLTLILAACEAGAPAVPAAATAQGEPTAPAAIISPPDTVIASAEAQPAQEARLSFPISAPVKEVFVKEGDAVKAGQLLMTLYTPDFEGAALQAELKEKAAALEFTYWIPHRFDRPPERKQQAEAEWNQTKTALQIAQASLKQNSIYAPFDGVIAEVYVQPGEFVGVGQVVLVLADFAHMQIVTTDLSERDVARVQPGQSAEIYIEALGLSVSGKVTRIAPRSQTVGGDVTYPVTIELQKPVEGLLWGMTAEVEIAVQ